MTHDVMPFIPQKPFHVAATQRAFLSLFQQGLEDMWQNMPKQQGDILTHADPTFLIVTTRAVADTVTRGTFPLKLRQRTGKEFGPNFTARLEWDPLTPAQLRHVTSNMPAALPEDAPLATPRPRIRNTVVYFTAEEARAIGLPNHRF